MEILELVNDGNVSVAEKLGDTGGKRTEIVRDMLVYAKHGVKIPNG